MTDKRLARSAALGFTLRLFHKSESDIASFAPFAHLGTIEQSNMRAAGRGANIMPLLVRIGRAKRVRDTGRNRWDEAAFRRYQRQGYDAVVYLNRFEGIELDAFEQARARGIDLDRCTDSAFRKAIPQAADSYVVFDPCNIRSTFARFEDGRAADLLA